MTGTVGSETLVPAKTQRLKPVQVAGAETDSGAGRNVASEIQGGSPDWEPWRGSIEFRHRPGSRREAPATGDIGSAFPEEAKTAGAQVADGGLPRRMVVRLIRADLDSERDNALRHHVRKLVQGEVKSVPGPERRQLAALNP